MLSISEFYLPRRLYQCSVETNAQAILVSSLYGHGEIDCRGMRDKCIEGGIGDIYFMLGEILLLENKISTM